MQKVALVTGGARGLGRETSLALASRGYAVAVNYLRSDNEARELSKSIKDVLLLKADVSESAAVGRMADEVVSRWSRLDVLVNNAGTTADALLIKLKEEDWDRVLGTNLKGCFNTIRVFAPLMRDSGGGHIVNVSSVSGTRGKEGQAAYAASKAALLGLTVSAARELSEYNIRVNALLPGYMPTDMGRANPAAMAAARGKSLSGRLSDPAEVAAFIGWLVGTESITGQVFTLDSRI
jgi:3-oxoacyl-[acyl-carrier protein] reductase